MLKNSRNLAFFMRFSLTPSPLMRTRTYFLDVFEGRLFLVMRLRSPPVNIKKSRHKISGMTNNVSPFLAWTQVDLLLLTLSSFIAYACTAGQGNFSNFPDNWWNVIWRLDVGYKKSFPNCIALRLANLIKFSQPDRPHWLTDKDEESSKTYNQYPVLGHFDG